MRIWASARPPPEDFGRLLQRRLLPWAVVTSATWR